MNAGIYYLEQLSIFQVYWSTVLVLKLYAAVVFSSQPQET